MSALGHPESGYDLASFDPPIRTRFAPSLRWPLVDPKLVSKETYMATEQ